MPSGRRDAVIDKAYQVGRDDASQEGRQHRACREEGSRDVVACWTLMHRGILESKPARNLIGDWWQRAGRKVIGRQSRCGNRKEEAQEAPRRGTWGFQSRLGDVTAEDKPARTSIKRSWPFFSGFGV
jgi:hypothetical protein